VEINFCLTYKYPVRNCYCKIPEVRHARRHTCRILGKLEKISQISKNVTTSTAGRILCRTLSRDCMRVVKTTWFMRTLLKIGVIDTRTPTNINSNFSSLLRRYIFYARHMRQVARYIEWRNGRDERSRGRNNDFCELCTTFRTSRRDNVPAVADPFRAINQLRSKSMKENRNSSRDFLLFDPDNLHTKQRDSHLRFG
jgi:hypothetical protein